LEARDYSPVDRFIMGLDQALRTVFGAPAASGRRSPAADVPESAMTEQERIHSARLMRVDHSGEVAAQALYQGQALAAREPRVQKQMAQAAAEENDHLAWCAERIEELGGRLSLLNPVWYGGALAIGALAGLAGDRWSLGFLAETERQVVTHLDGHLERLPAQDLKSRAVLARMRQDEGHHATTAALAGAAPLPEPIRTLMRYASRVMTETAYWA
jgi:ubiquinone biosynthesis monooxygenase Coq7